MESFHLEASLQLLDLDKNNMLNNILKKQIKQFSLENIPNESCGLIIEINDEYKFIKCRNVSFHKKTESIVHPMDYVMAEKQGKVISIVHSQPSAGTSFTDNVTAYNQNLFSVVYSWETDQFYLIAPELKDYLFKDFKLGEYDCLELVRNYYREELNINISPYNQSDSWFLNNPTIIYDNFKKEGFIEINRGRMRKNDVILFGNNKEIGHLAIAMGNNLMLHHPRESKSIIEDIHHLWESKISLVVRHNDLCGKI